MYGYTQIYVNVRGEARTSGRNRRVFHTASERASDRTSTCTAAGAAAANCTDSGTHCVASAVAAAAATAKAQPRRSANHCRRQRMDTIQLRSRWRLRRPRRVT